MAYLSDLLVAAAALGAAFYCFILSRRLQALSRLDGGLGSAIALLSAQVDDLSRTLSAARENADRGATALDAQIARAEAACGRLDLLLASLHDLPGPDTGANGRDATAPVGPSQRAPIDEGHAIERADRGTITPAAHASTPPQGGAEPEERRTIAARTLARSSASTETTTRARIVRRRKPLERV